MAGAATRHIKLSGQRICSRFKLRSYEVALGLLRVAYGNSRRGRGVTLIVAGVREAEMMEGCKAPRHQQERGLCATITEGNTASLAWRW